ncbi:NINE protein [Flavobacterium sp. F372]|uniref:NINE protein n=1 Tax=Flavobacterium bernardetii TaxID=2813823 RepID=A0ABR7J185_9FLAO|nr:NINE protein [Flavobacterium bernardetii]MBC5835825.1 NINE protein [Flavobacterium bernardetii]NHF69555.1 NINE protein [Flavobacterium bernardetii]
MQKSKTTSAVLCFFFGILGIHRFYLGYTLIGILQLFTFGGFGLWTLIDFILIVTGNLKEKQIVINYPVQSVVKANNTGSKIEKKYSFSNNFYVAGTHIVKRKNYILKNCYDGMLVKLVPEPTNKVDPNAIAVKDEFEETLGYIPSDKTSIVNKLLKSSSYKVFIDEYIIEDSFSNPGTEHVKLYIRVDYD